MIMRSPSMRFSSNLHERFVSKGSFYIAPTCNSQYLIFLPGGLNQSITDTTLQIIDL